MTWRARDDVWYGTALVRPEHERESALGGAYVSFFVVGRDIRAALDSLLFALRAQDWNLTSLLKMSRASDFEPGGDEGRFDDLAHEADTNGVALGAFHTFPKEEQRPQ